MSKAAALAFRDKVAQNPELQAKVRQAIEAGQSLEEAVRLGKQHGHEFTVEEAEQAMEEVSSGELSQFELEMVAGGKGRSRGDQETIANPPVPITGGPRWARRRGW